MKHQFSDLCQVQIVKEKETLSRLEHLEKCLLLTLFFFRNLGGFEKLVFSVPMCILMHLTT